MRERALTIPEIGIIAGTRVAFGVGLGLLLAEKMKDDTRKGAACALLLVGALTTIPILLGVLEKPQVKGVPESL